MKKIESKTISRRDALKYMGAGTLGIFAASSGLASLASGCTSAPVEATAGTRAYKGGDEKVSLIGFGCMRLPLTSESIIDEEKSQALIDYAYEHGVNYFDTAWNYINGASEPFVGKALKKFPRNTVNIATKMPTWEINSLDRGKEIFRLQLERLQTTYIDYYLLHALSNRKEYDFAYRECGVLDYLKREKAAGLIRHLGFSYHGDTETLKYILDDSDWDFVQLQINYYDWDEQYTRDQYKMLEERGIPCIVMEPVRGGMLAKLTPDAEAVLKDENSKRSIASWAIRFCGSLPGVLTVLSGMNQLEHVQDNIHSLSTDFKPLNESEKEAIGNALAIFKKTRPIRCTTCRYCMPCPYGVAIPDIFAFYNQCVNESKLPDLDNPTGKEFKKRKRAFQALYSQIPSESQANHCIKCGKCLKKCPQHIAIPNELARIDKMVQQLSGNK